MRFVPSGLPARAGSPDRRAGRVEKLGAAIATVLCVKFCKGGHGLAGLGGLAEVGFPVLPEIVHVEIAVGLEPVLMGFDS